MDQVVVAQFIDRLASAFEEDDADAAVKAAESANVRRVQENYRALARGDLAAFLDAMAEDVEMEFVGSPARPVRRAMAGPGRGRAGRPRQLLPGRGTATGNPDRRGPG